MSNREPARLRLAAAADAKRELALHAAVTYLDAPLEGHERAVDEVLDAVVAWAKAERAAGRIR